MRAIQLFIFYLLFIIFAFYYYYYIIDAHNCQNIIAIVAHEISAATGPMIIATINFNVCEYP